MKKISIFIFLITIITLSTQYSFASQNLSSNSGQVINGTFKGTDFYWKVSPIYTDYTQNQKFELTIGLMNNSKNQLSFNIRVEVFKDENQTTPLLTVEDKIIQIDSEEMELIFIEKLLNLQPETYYLIVEVKCQEHDAKNTTRTYINIQ